VVEHGIRRIAAFDAGGFPITKKYSTVLGSNAHRVYYARIKKT